MWGAAPILAASTPTLTSTQVVEIWVTAAVSGILAYVFAVYSRRATGTYPWRVPAIIWGILGVLIPVFSLLIEAVARLTTRPVTPPGAGSYFGGPQDQPVGNGRPPGAPSDWQSSQPSGGWQPPASWQPPQWQAPSQPPNWQPPSHWQPPLSPQAQGGEGTGAATGSTEPPTPWTPGSPGAPAAPSWPPPLGPDAFVPTPGHGYPGYPGQGQGQAYPQATPSPQPSPPPSPQPSWSAPPRPAQPTVPQAAMQGPNGWNQPPPYVPAPTPPPLFGWYPDPTGRHEQRYWDGRHWSHRVSDGGVRGDDPLYPVQDPSSAPSGSSLAVTSGTAGPQVAPDGAAVSDEAGEASTTDEQSEVDAGGEPGESEPED